MLRRFFSTAPTDIKMLRQNIRTIENQILKSRFKYLIRPMRYDGTEAELRLEIERLEKEIAKHSATALSNVGIPREFKPLA
jgi:hypothetical protein